MSEEGTAQTAEDRPTPGAIRATRMDPGRPAHEWALHHAGAARLARAIRPYGTLRKETLAKVAGAEHWSAGAFEHALEAAIDEGLLRPLSFGFYQSVE